MIVLILFTHCFIIYLQATIIAVTCIIRMKNISHLVKAISTAKINSSIFFIAIIKRSYLFHSTITFKVNNTKKYIFVPLKCAC